MTRSTSNVSLAVLLSARVAIGASFFLRTRYCPNAGWNDLNAGEKSLHPICFDRLGSRLHIFRGHHTHDGKGHVTDANHDAPLLKFFYPVDAEACPHRIIGNIVRVLDGSGASTGVVDMEAFTKF